MTKIPDLLADLIRAKRKKVGRPKPGDIGLLQIEEYLWARLQLLGSHPTLDEAILVDPNLIGSSGEPLAGRDKESYIIFYQFSYFVRRSLIKVVDHDPPSQLVPSATRIPQRIGNRPWKSWVIFDPAGGKTICDELTDDEIAIPTGSIISHELLVNRLRAGWQPADDVA